MIDYYVFPNYLATLMLAFFAVVIIYGRLEVALGIFCSLTFWMENIFVGSVAIFWVMAPAVILSAASYWLRVGHKHFYILEKDINFLIWTFLWALWMFALLTIYKPENSWLFTRNFLGFILLPTFGITLFAADTHRLLWFFLSFIFVTLFAGYLAFTALSLPLDILLHSTGFRLMPATTVDTIAFSKPFGISIVMLYGMILLSKNIFLKLFFGISICFCFLMMLLVNTRQTILGVVSAIIAFSLWAFWKSGFLFKIILVTILSGIAFGVYSFLATTTLSDRWADGFAYGDVGGRSEVWGDAWRVFLKSPILGSGLDYFHTGWFAHNIILDVLAGQGIVGFIFLVGFFVFAGNFALRNTNIFIEGVSGWKMINLSLLLFTITHLQFTGGMIVAFDFFWFSALVWRINYAFPVEKSLENVVMNDNNMFENF